jgi:hypothetical protein
MERVPRRSPLRFAWHDKRVAWHPPQAESHACELEARLFINPLEPFSVRTRQLYGCPFSTTAIALSTAIL